MAIIRYVGLDVQLVESTQVPGFTGVVERPFVDEFEDYKSGSIGLWAPLRPDVRQSGNWVAWRSFVDGQQHHHYATLRMMTEAYNSFIIRHKIPILDVIAEDVADPKNLKTEFCSSLWCASFQAAGILSSTRQPSLTAPIDALRAAIYSPAKQIMGDTLKADFGFNTVYA